MLNKPLSKDRNHAAPSARPALRRPICRSASGRSQSHQCQGFAYFLPSQRPSFQMSGIELQSKKRFAPRVNASVLGLRTCLPIDSPSKSGFSEAARQSQPDRRQRHGRIPARASSIQSGASRTRGEAACAAIYRTARKIAAGSSRARRVSSNHDFPARSAIPFRRHVLPLVHHGAR